MTSECMTMRTLLGPGYSKSILTVQQQPVVPRMTQLTHRGVFPVNNNTTVLEVQSVSVDTIVHRGTTLSRCANCRVQLHRALQVLLVLLHMVTELGKAQLATTMGGRCTIK